MKRSFKRLLSSVALLTGLTFGSTQANAYPFYFENSFEEQLWAYAEDINSVDGYAVFLSQFATSVYADEARARLAVLASEGDNPTRSQIQLMITRRERGLFSVIAEEGADPYVRSFDLAYGG